MSSKSFVIESFWMEDIRWCIFTYKKPHWISTKRSNGARERHLRNGIRRGNVHVSKTYWTVHHSANAIPTAAAISKPRLLSNHMVRMKMETMIRRIYYFLRKNAYVCWFACWKYFWENLNDFGRILSFLHNCFSQYRLL